jgi:hypothetical protein
MNAKVEFNKLDTQDQSYIKKYVLLNSTKSLNVKCGFQPLYQGTNYAQYYYQHQVSFTPTEKSLLNKIIQDIMDSKCFGEKSPLKLLSSHNMENDCKWNIIKTKDLELNLPCTLSKVILLPIFLFLSPSLKETLIHEQMHILQRQHQELFNKEYKSLFGQYIYLVNKKDINYDALDVNSLQIQNPDEDDTQWIIHNAATNKHYIVPYIYNSDTKGVSTQTAYQIEPNTLVVTGTTVPISELEYTTFLKSLVDGQSLNCAHPNETYTDLFLFKLKL